MLTPVKAIKGQCEELKQRDKAFNALFSTAVSKVGQTYWGFLQLAERKNKYSKSDESNIYQRTVSSHLRKVGDRFFVPYFLTLDSHN